MPTTAIIPRQTTAIATTATTITAIPILVMTTMPMTAITETQAIMANTAMAAVAFPASVLASTSAQDTHITATTHPTMAIINAHLGRRIATALITQAMAGAIHLITFTTITTIQNQNRQNISLISLDSMLGSPLCIHVTRLLIGQMARARANSHIVR